MEKTALTGKVVNSEEVIEDLGAETVKGSSRSLEGVDNVEGGDGLSLGVLSVSDGVLDDTLEEDLEDRSGLFVDQAGNSLDTTSSCQSSNSGLGDTGDVVSVELVGKEGAR